MPVQTGYGKKTLDYLFCIGGVFAAIETKAPGKKPTPLQETTIKEIKDAGGEVFVIDDVTPETLQPLKEFLNNATRTCKPKAPSSGCPLLGAN